MSGCAALLICPVCGAALEDHGGSLLCGRGHNFDRARAGYIDLLPPGHGRAGIRGDSRAMVEARRRFLARGHFDIISDAVNRRALTHLAARDTGDRIVVLDAGCGEGSYLRRLAAACGGGAVSAFPPASSRPASFPAGAAAAAGEACFIGADISRDALRAAARALPDGVFIVNDVGHRVCVADASVDVLLDVFAPRNVREFARVLRPGGALIVAIPAVDHLHELRERLPLLRVQEEKLERTFAAFAPAFELAAHDGLRTTVRMAADDVRDLVRMGPSHWHLADADYERVDAADVTIAVEVLVMRARAS